MKIILISNMTPYRENFNGTSALPYHLLYRRNAGTESMNIAIGLESYDMQKEKIEVEVYSFNINRLPGEKVREAEKELGIKIHIIPLSRWLVFLFKFHLLFFRLFLKYPLHYYLKLSPFYIKEIEGGHPDGIWVYGEEMSRVINQFSGLKRVHTTVDCTSLYYHRLLKSGLLYGCADRLKAKINYRKFYRLEEHYLNGKDVKYHLVGQADRDFLVDHNSELQAYFIRHPHYEVVDSAENREFHTPIRLLIAGQCNLYMQRDTEELIKELCLFSDVLSDGGDIRDCYELLFLGKGWEQSVEILETSGWKVKHIRFAPDYIKEIKKHDIQLTPISIGTGTKGKVLDAIANGLLVIGTPYALENIAVKSGESCIEYHSTAEAIDILQKIPMERKKYEQIAEQGREAVCRYHSRKLISEQLFNLFK